MPLIKCPECSKQVSERAHSCPHCGYPLEKEFEKTIFEFSEPVEKEANSINNLYEATLGEKNRTYYLIKFKQFDQQGLSLLKASWNWPAFFFNFIWALYRKMYVWFFVFLNLGYLINFLFEISDSTILNALISFIPSILSGIFGNSLYHNNVRKKIAVAQRNIKDKTRLLNFLKHKGGVNEWVIGVSILLFIVFVIFVILFLKQSPLFMQTFTHSSYSDSETQSDYKMDYDRPSDYFMTPKELYKKYEANEVSADNEYKNKIIRLWEGKIEDIGKDLFDKGYITLKNRLDSGESYNVQCFFTPKDEPLIAKVKKDMQVEVQGRCEGKILGHVLMKDCKFMGYPFH